MAVVVEIPINKAAVHKRNAVGRAVVLLAETVDMTFFSSPSGGRFSLNASLYTMQRPCQRPRKTPAGIIARGDRHLATGRGSRRAAPQSRRHLVWCARHLAALAWCAVRSRRGLAAIVACAEIAYA